MTNVSKNKLDDKTRQQLFLQFSTLFTGADHNRMACLFESLFTDTEKIMFIKRLAIILMISQEHSSYSIGKALHVSDSTVRSLKEKFLKGEFDILVGATRKKNFDSKKFWETMDVLLRLGMPSYNDKDRWKFLDR